MTILAAHELKGLQSQLAKERAAEMTLLSEAKLVKKKLADASSSVKSLEARVKELTMGASAPVVSEHAMLRWLERVYELNLDNIRADILSEGTDKAIAFMKSGNIQKDGVTLVVKNNVVVTVK